MIHDIIHDQIVQNCEKLTEWIASKKNDRYFPIYGSIDLRDSGYKVAGVDANIYPAGWNNICEVDRGEAPRLFKKYIERVSKNGAHSRLALLTEEHTNNSYYWDNVFVLRELLVQAGCDVRVCVPRPMQGPIDVPTASGRVVTVYSALRDADKIIIDKTFIPDLIVSNNDFSDSYEWWAQGLTTPVFPARELGWYQRKKSDHFTHYNRLATEFCEKLGIDPWHLTVATELMTDFNVVYPESRELLATRVDAMIAEIKTKYLKHKISDQPTVFIKNNAGTYGLAVTQVQSGDEIRKWSAKNRKVMQAAKGGRDVEEIIIQEGISSAIKSEDSTAEPVIYLVGCELAGGFLRTHSEKGPNESLNSPGAVFKKLCMSDLQVNMGGCPMENVYGWVARLNLLAISYEAAALGLRGP